MPLDVPGRAGRPWGRGPLSAYRPVMSTSGTSPSISGREPRACSDAGHLDLDAECLEDPVHCGDARHQHDVHAAEAAPAAGADPQPG
jgi:hypothetical protein